ncbi:MULTISPECIES: response regulator transcription factor [Paenibacillus]|jgi:DNA-binding response OmpR family regulator|uniref:Response regulator transcription factor n=1 Tax=Paenibacillus oceani TaxID=2772510 RepID=A0A927GY86_9BACL|nr:response regulator transcription factor [Paenibacillus oceani]MBD2860928.1 response regulator transcription factor [Paenibacillus oceani]MDF2657938.1 winged helix family two component transcriptional regulator [Paenibacillus sp.]
MRREKILIVDDEVEIIELICLYLAREGYQTLTALDGYGAIEMVDKSKPDLIILDIQLPDLDGFEVCLELRKMTKAPILFLSCKSEDLDKILGLGVGGDDYITKPFSPGEMVARVKAHLRRSRMQSEPVTPEHTLTFGELTIDPKSFTVRLSGEVVTLSAKEYQLLLLLAKNPDRVYSLDQLFTQVWESPSIGDPRTVMVHISNVRKKIEPDPAHPTYIVTVRGGGYKFNGSLAGPGN